MLTLNNISDIINSLYFVVSFIYDTRYQRNNLYQGDQHGFFKSTFCFCVFSDLLRYVHIYAKHSLA